MTGLDSGVAVGAGVGVGTAVGVGAAVGATVGSGVGVDAAAGATVGAGVSVGMGLGADAVAGWLTIDVDSASLDAVGAAGGLVSAPQAIISMVNTPTNKLARSVLKFLTLTPT